MGLLICRLYSILVEPISKLSSPNAQPTERKRTPKRELDQKAVKFVRDLSQGDLDGFYRLPKSRAAC
jgi:hypothetical protein